MYQAGPSKIAEQVTKDARKLGMDYEFTVQDAIEAIDAYFKEFKDLKKWIDKHKREIAQYGFVYSPFGRKRRLPNVFSDNKGVASHEVRSGLNFIVQSTASDVNLLAAIDMGNYIRSRPGFDAVIFALVHDSILAEVREDLADEYVKILTGFITKDRGVSIPGFPIGCDFEVGEDYSFGKFEKKYPEFFTNQNVDYTENS